MSGTETRTKTPLYPKTKRFKTSAIYPGHILARPMRVSYIHPTRQDDFQPRKQEGSPKSNHKDNDMSVDDEQGRVYSGLCSMVYKRPVLRLVVRQVTLRTLSTLTHSRGAYTVTYVVSSYRADRTLPVSLPSPLPIRTDPVSLPSPLPRGST